MSAAKKSVTLTKYDDVSHGDPITILYDNVFHVDHSDGTFLIVVHDDEGVTVEEMIRKSDILSVIVDHNEDLITPAFEAQEEVRLALEEAKAAEQEARRQLKLANSGLSVIKS